MSDEQSDSTAGKWTVRAVSNEARSAAAKAARQAGQDLGPWLSRVIIEAAQAQLRSDRAPAVVRPEPVAGPTVDLAELERMMALAAQYHAVAGRTPRTITGPLARMLRVRLRGMAGPTQARGGSD